MTSKQPRRGKDRKPVHDRVLSSVLATTSTHVVLLRTRMRSYEMRDADCQIQVYRRAHLLGYLRELSLSSVDSDD